eukprot:TRINITY_DN32719_c0_g1_i1.p1 TRINITY_DN32719_c0_g1~~TRINITY_DN32719_c0_g1_i1.p1  ORF type:complete len:469 (+),score=127.13 TRINITY_DN32719_c0_g1_i1:144-1550(+)
MVLHVAQRQSGIKGKDSTEKSREESDDDMWSESSSEETTLVDENDHSCVGNIRRLTLSMAFSSLTAAMIVLNVVLLAVQADYPEPPKLFGKVDLWYQVNMVFLLFFSLELFFRFVTYGCHDFWLDDDPSARHWNYFDFTIVAFGWVDFFITVTSGAVGGASKYVQILRIIRILRITRVLRIFRALRKLQWLVEGLTESFGIVLWIVLMMTVMMLMISIFVTTMVGQQADEWNHGDAQQIRMYFGTVPRSMQTLFQYLTLDDWGMISRLVAKKKPIMILVFLAYVVFAAFVILSLLTGVMAEHMGNLRDTQEKEERAEQLRKVREAKRTFLNAFERLDKSQDHQISREEFRAMMTDKQLLKELENISLNLGEADADDLFNCLDLDHDDLINWMEFKYGMNELRQDVTSRTIIVLRTRINRLIEQGRQIPIGDLDNSLKATTERIGTVQCALSKFEQTMDKFEEYIDELS